MCVAGNSIETPRLLLNSASALFPDGLANSSGQVGRNYMRHLTASVYAIFDKPVRMYRGETMAGHIEDEAPNDPSRGFVGGYYLQLLALGVPFMAAFVDPGGWGREFTAILEGYERMAGLWLVGEDMPQETNRVTLNTDELDQYGQPVPNVHFDDHPNDLAMREHAWAAGEALYESVGALQDVRTPPYPATHNLGTARMSERPEDGVVNAFGPGARRAEPVRLRRQPVHRPARPPTRRSRSSRWRSARPSTSPSSCARSRSRPGHQAWTAATPAARCRRRAARSRRERRRYVHTCLRVRDPRRRCASTRRWASSRAGG